AVLRAPGPAPAGLVATFAGGAEQAVLLDGEDALLQPDQVRLERGHVHEEERQALVPAVRDVADVERRDEEAGVGLVAAATRVGHPWISHPQRSRSGPAAP